MEPISPNDPQTSIGEVDTSSLHCREDRNIHVGASTVAKEESDN